MDADIERADFPRRPISHDQYAAVDSHLNEEEQALLPTASSPRRGSLALGGQTEKSEPDEDLQAPQARSGCCKSKSKTRSWKCAASMAGSFTGGIIACLAVQSINFRYNFYPGYSSSSNALFAAKSGKHFHFPPAQPTNGGPEYATYFPTDVGYAGPTPTGNEAGLIQTAPAYPFHTGAAGLVGPTSIKGSKGKGKPEFDIFRHWGNLR